jgi:hypothetical protein
VHPRGMLWDTKEMNWVCLGYPRGCSGDARGVDPASPRLSEDITGFSRGVVGGYAVGGPHTEWGCSVHAGGMRGGNRSCKSSRNEQSSKRLELLVKVPEPATYLKQPVCGPKGLATPRRADAAARTQHWVETRL